MTPAPRRVLGALLVLLGLALAVPGGWLLSHLGTSGSATFSASPGATGPVLLPPSLLNRVDAPVRVRATAGDGQPVWIGVASPSDARSALDGGAHTALTRVELPGFTLRAVRRAGPPAPEVSSLDLWSEAVSADGAAQVTVHQADAPQTAVVAAPAGTRVEATWTRPAWSAQAAAVTGVGAVLVVVGGVLVATAGRGARR